MERVKRAVQYCVLVAGFMNAGAIGLQAMEILRTRSAAGHVAAMYFVFLFIQASLIANAALHRDKWQAAGMVANMAATIWVVVLLFRFG